MALVIVGLGAVAVLEALGGELRSSARTSRALEVEALGRERLARLELVNSEDLEHLPDSLARGQFGPPFADYVWKAQSRAVTGVPGLYDVEVQINWEAGSYPLHTRLYRAPSSVGTP